VELESLGADTAYGGATVEDDGVTASISISAAVPALKDRGQVYEAWLYNDPGDVYSLGWARPDDYGRLELEGILPPEHARYDYIDVSVERVPSNGFHSERSVLRGWLGELEP
jgi:anti-sigma-K factor RskA